VRTAWGTNTGMGSGLGRLGEAVRSGGSRAASSGRRLTRWGYLLAAAEIALAAHPGWGAAGIRFDVLLVDGAGRVRRIADAFRLQDEL
jgi:Holliday junction resolvase-like predicted endonuclease